MIEGRELDGYELFGGRVLPVEDPAERPVFRNITLRGCAVRDCFFEGALLEDVLIDGLTAPQDPRQRVSACASTGWCSVGISVMPPLPDLGPWHAGLQPRYRRANGEHWVELISEGDWALDISGITSGLDFRSAVPARLGSADPETQVVVTAEQAAGADWRSVPGLEKSLLGVQIGFLQSSDHRDTILIADKSAPDRARQWGCCANSSGSAPRSPTRARLPDCLHHRPLQLHPVCRRPTHCGAGVVPGVQVERATVRTTWTPGASSARLCLG